MSGTLKLHSDNLERGERLLIAISTQGDAFKVSDDPSAELARMLRDLARDIEQGNAWTSGDTIDCSLRDMNGNRCGRVSLKVRP